MKNNLKKLKERWEPGTKSTGNEKYNYLVTKLRLANCT